MRQSRAQRERDVPHDETISQEDNPDESRQEFKDPEDISSNLAITKKQH